MKTFPPVMMLSVLLSGAGGPAGAAEKAGPTPVPAPAPAPAAAKPADAETYEARFKEVKQWIAELELARSQPPAPLDPRHNPFRTPGSIVMAARPGADSDGGARVPTGAGLAPAESTPGTNLSVLQQGAATLRVSGIVEINGSAHLVINKRPYKQGALVPTQVQGETVYLRVKEIARRSVTLSLEDAEMTLKF